MVRSTDEWKKIMQEHLDRPQRTKANEVGWILQDLCTKYNLSIVPLDGMKGQKIALMDYDKEDTLALIIFKNFGQVKDAGARSADGKPWTADRLKEQFKNY